MNKCISKKARLPRFFFLKNCIFIAEHQEQLDDIHVIVVCSIIVQLDQLQSCRSLYYQNIAVLYIVCTGKLPQQHDISDGDE